MGIKHITPRVDGADGCAVHHPPSSLLKCKIPPGSARLSRGAEPRRTQMTVTNAVYRHSFPAPCKCLCEPDSAALPRTRLPCSVYKTSRRGGRPATAAWHRMAGKSISCYSRSATVTQRHQQLSPRVRSQKPKRDVHQSLPA